MDKGKIVRQFREVRNHVTDPLPGFATLPEFVLWSSKVSRRSLKGHRRSTGKWLVIPLDEIWFVIPGLQLTHRPRTEDHNDIFCLRRKVRVTRCIRASRVNERTIRRRPKEAVAS